MFLASNPILASGSHPRQQTTAARVVQPCSVSNVNLSSRRTSVVDTSVGSPRQRWISGQPWKLDSLLAPTPRPCHLHHSSLACSRYSSAENPEADVTSGANLTVTMCRFLVCSRAILSLQGGCSGLVDLLFCKERACCGGFACHKVWKDGDGMQADAPSFCSRCRGLASGTMKLFALLYHKINMKLAL